MARNRKAWVQMERKLWKRHSRLARIQCIGACFGVWPRLSTIDATLSFFHEDPAKEKLAITLEELMGDNYLMIFRRRLREFLKANDQPATAPED